MLFLLIIAAYVIVAYTLNFFILRVESRTCYGCSTHSILAVVWLLSFVTVYVGVFCFIVDNFPYVLDRLGRFIAGGSR